MKIFLRDLILSSLRTVVKGNRFIRHLVLESLKFTKLLELQVQQHTIFKSTGANLANKQYVVLGWLS